jgi:hypothetical protein
MILSNIVYKNSKESMRDMFYKAWGWKLRPKG